VPATKMAREDIARAQTIASLLPTPTTPVTPAEPPKSLADKLFLACSENWTSVNFLASLLKENDAAIVAEAEKDARLKLSATRKSICKL